MGLYGRILFYKSLTHIVSTQNKSEDKDIHEVIRKVVMNLLMKLLLSSCPLPGKINAFAIEELHFRSGCIGMRLGSLKLTLQTRLCLFWMTGAN